MAGFVIVAVLLLICAIGVVRSENLVHSVFWLAGALLSTAVAFVLLHAPFIGMIQVVLYTGGVITLMLFGVMLTQRDPSVDVPSPVQRQLPAGLVALAMFVTLTAAILTTPQLETLRPVDMGNSAAVGQAFLTSQLIAFEVLSMLLLAGMIGAIVLTRKEDP